MRPNSPLITLLAGAAFGVVLLIASTEATPAATAPYEASATPSASASAGTAASASPSPSTADTPAAPKGPDRADYTGPARGGGATVAVSVRGAKAIGFVCTASGTAHWLTGAATGGLFDLSGPGNATLNGRYRDHRADGHARAGGVRYIFTLLRAQQSGLRASIQNRTAQACQPPAPPAGGGGGDNDGGGGHHHGGGGGGGD
jgi:hypothetical protein